MGSFWTSSSPHQDLEGEIQAQNLINFPQTLFPYHLVLYSIQLLLFSPFLNLHWCILQGPEILA